MPETLDEKLARTEAYDEEVRHHFLKEMQADPTLYVADFVIYGALKRTLALSDGFRRHIRERNFTCAAALLRLQLDTALRLYGASLYRNPFDYAEAVFHGKPINRLKDRNGEKMTDSYLAKRMNREFPWVKKMYDQLCDFIHFSNRHIFSAFAKASQAEEDDHTVRLVIGARDPPRPESDYFEIVDGYLETMRVTLQLTSGWHAAIHRSRKPARALHEIIT